MPEAATLGVDTGYYVYAVVPADQPLPDALRGLDDAPVELVELEGIAAAVGVITLERPPGRRADLMAHSAVIDALAASGTVVPVQFGSVLADRESVVEDLLGDQHDHYADLLTALAGTVQLNLRAIYREEQALAEVVMADPGIARLRERTRDLPPGTMHPDLVRLGEEVSRAMERKRAEDTDGLLPLVVDHAVDHRLRALGDMNHVFDVALLVERDRVEALEERLEEVAEVVHERIRLQLTGPFAAYDFVEDPGWG
jgi:hypothetical protein